MSGGPVQLGHRQEQGRHRLGGSEAVPRPADGLRVTAAPGRFVALGGGLSGERLQRWVRGKKLGLRWVTADEGSGKRNVLADRSE